MGKVSVLYDRNLGEPTEKLGVLLPNNSLLRFLHSWLDIYRLISYWSIRPYGLLVYVYVDEEVQLYYSRAHVKQLKGI